MAREPITDEQVPTSLDGEEVKERCCCFFSVKLRNRGASSIFFGYGFSSMPVNPEIFMG